MIPSTDPLYALASQLPSLPPPSLGTHTPGAARPNISVLGFDPDSRMSNALRHEDAQGVDLHPASHQQPVFESWVSHLPAVRQVEGHPLPEPQFPHL